MAEHLLTLNAGSSSIKFALFDCNGDLTEPALSGQVEGLGSTAGSLTHEQALLQVLDQVRDAALAPQIVAIGHRVVHGGTHWVEPARVDAAVLQQMAALEPLAPLHQPHNVAGVRSAMSAFPGVPQFACFDTAFHATQSPVNQRFALPARYFDEGVRRYGFHGLSYESVMAQFAVLSPETAQGRVVVAHLGNGASVCAIDAGRSVATSMSFSPLDGLTMGTRCGQLDAAVVLYLLTARGMTVDEVTTLLYRQSGLLGLSGISSDMRELEASTSQSAAVAIEHFVEQVVQQTGRMVAALRGIDAIVFTGGMGENAVALRGRILHHLAWLGIEPDATANRDAKSAGGARIAAKESPVAAWVIKTNEEAAIARHTARLFHQIVH